MKACMHLIIVFNIHTHLSITFAHMHNSKTHTYLINTITHFVIMHLHNMKTINVYLYLANIFMHRNNICSQHEQNTYMQCANQDL